MSENDDRILKKVLEENKLGGDKMSRSNSKANKSFQNATNNQEKLENAVNSIQAKRDNLNNNHNVKKESLGPNTKR